MDAITRKPLYGLMAEFDTTPQIVRAARAAKEAGYKNMDAFSPFPIHEMDEAMGINRTVLPFLVFGGGVAGLLGGLFLQYYTLVIDYPINVGGRPYASWVAFVPPAFETTILFAAFTAVFGMLILNGLPTPYHPVFNNPRFVLASREKFFLVIEADDPKFDGDETTAFLRGLGAREVIEIDE